jgi:hypothetical protein
MIARDPRCFIPASLISVHVDALYDHTFACRIIALRIGDVDVIPLHRQRGTYNLERRLWIAFRPIGTDQRKDGDVVACILESHPWSVPDGNVEIPIEGAKA